MSDKVPVADQIEEYCSQLRRRQLEGSLPCAKRTAEIMRVLVTMQRHADAASLIDDVRSVGYKIQAAKPVELAIGNMVRRVLHIIREEAQNEELQSQQAQQAASAASSSEKQLQAKSQAGLLTQALKVPGGPARGTFASRAVSLSNLLDVGIADLDRLIGQAVDGQTSPAAPAASAPAAARQQQGADYELESQTSAVRARGSKKAAPQWKSKHVVIDAINELIDELENIQASITVQGVEHIHANEVILTFGMSDTTYYFLKEASKKREFQVVVAEAAPNFDGHLMARKLSDAGIMTTVIADSAVFAMMARANKVLVGAHAVLANGGVIAPVGIHMVALAAKCHSIPFVVLVGLHKLSPLFPHDPDLAYNEFKSPSEVAEFDSLAQAFAQQLPSLQRGQQEAGLGAAVGSPANDSGAGVVHIPNPAFDYIPPHLISLFVTDTGGYTPSYVYRLLTEYYSREDYLLSKELFTAGR